MTYPMSITFHCHPGDSVYVIDPHITDECHIKYTIFRDRVYSVSARVSGIYYETVNCFSLIWMKTIFPDRSLAIEYATANNLDFEEVEGGITDEN